MLGVFRKYCHDLSPKVRKVQNKSVVYILNSISGRGHELDAKFPVLGSDLYLIDLVLNLRYWLKIIRDGCRSCCSCDSLYNFSSTLFFSGMTVVAWLLLQIHES